MTDITEIYSPPRPSIPATTRPVALAALTLCTLLIHGYHPFAEDGGVYVAAIESILNPALFPHDLAFATATRHYSLFAPAMACIVRALHLPLPWLLLLVYIAGIWLTLYAASKIAAQCLPSERAQLYAVAILAASFTLPIAGTSLLLMDPYVTARTLSTPLSLLAIAFALASTKLRDRAALLRCLLCIAAAAAFHILMAAYAAGFILTLLAAKLPNRRTRLLTWTLLASAALLTAGLLQATAPAESVPAVAAAFSRYYWFLSRWQWFEWLGLAGPLAMFALLLRFSRTHLTESGRDLCRAGIVAGSIATLVALLFAQQHFNTHIVARVQPLRTFLLPYAIMAILLGGAATETRFRRRTEAVPTLLLIAIAAVMFFVQRETFPTSQHIELPWRSPTNPWSQAFVWARDHTPTDALFALDANYVTTPGNEGQTFRATAQRSALPDFSKDGGEAAIRPSLAPDWFTGQQAQTNLSTLTPGQRTQRLAPLGVTWLILQSNSPTPTPCPYQNAAVKVCPLR